MLQSPRMLGAALSKTKIRAFVSKPTGCLSLRTFRFLSFRHFEYCRLGRRFVRLLPAAFSDSGLVLDGICDRGSQEARHGFVPAKPSAVTYFPFPISPTFSLTGPEAR